MAKVTAIQGAFNAGELSPLLTSRPDLRAYGNGLSTCENFIPLIQGALMSRPGTRYVKDLLSHTAVGRLIPFQFSTTQSYALEFGNGRIRFFSNHAYLTTTVAVAGAADNGLGLVRITTGAAHGFATGTVVAITGIVGTTEANGTWTITVISATTFDLQGSTFANAYSSGGSASFEGIESPYLTADIPSIKYTQSADVLYLVHPDYAPRKLARTGAYSWTLSVIEFVDGPYLLENISATTITPGATSGPTTWTASAPIFAGTSADVGRVFRFKDAANDWFWVKITAHSSTTVVTGTAYAAGTNNPGTLSSTAARTTWRLGAWSATTGYPSAVAFQENRLVFGDEPAQTLDFSRTSDYENFAPSDTDGVVGDSYAIQVTLADEQVNRIRWMMSFEKGLAVGTTGGEWIVRPSNLNEALTPTNVKAVPTTRHGSADYQAVRVADAAIFIQSSRKKVREYSYSFESDGFRAPDLTLLSEHITKPGIKWLAYQQEPRSIVWTVRDDGELIGLTRERDQDVAGWTRHVMGGVSDASGTKAKVESVIAISAPNGDRDEIWLIVQRWVNGATKRFVEYLEDEWETGDGQEHAFFVDAGITYDGAATSTITGLDHLEGESVAVLADGAPHPNKVVSGGQITLDREAEVVQVGLYRARQMVSLPFEQGAADGSAVGKTKRIHHLNIRFYETLGGKYGDGSNWDEILFRSGSDLMDNPPPVFSGDKELLWPSGYGKQMKVAIKQEQPLPMTVLSIVPQLHTQDR